MAASSSLSILLANPVPKISCNNQIGNMVSAFNQRTIKKLVTKYGSRTRLYAAGLSEIEPDLNEDPRDRWATPGVDAVCVVLSSMLSLCVFSLCLYVWSC